MRAESRDPLGLFGRAVAEAVQAHALLADAAQIDVGSRSPGRGCKALGLGQRVAHLVNRGLAVPGEVGRRFARAGRGIEVGGDARARIAPRRAGAAYRPCRW